MALVTAELYWFRMLLRDLSISLSSPPTLWCDNAGAISLAFNHVFHTKTKHIEVDYHFIREKVLNKDILVRHIFQHMIILQMSLPKVILQQGLCFYGPH
jgi:hypothetical protein